MNDAEITGCSTSLVFQEMKNKIPIRYHFISTQNSDTLLRESKIVQIPWKTV
jgi:hypothetical protein